MNKKKKYPQPHSIKTNNKEIAKKIHNAIKHNEIPRYWLLEE